MKNCHSERSEESRLSVTCINTKIRDSSLTLRMTKTEFFKDFNDEKMEKILLDTDIGSDIDDVVCLSYLLCQPECELVGITTTIGPVKERAKIASALCKNAEKEIPIVPGLRRPMLKDWHEHGLRQARALENWEHDTDFPKIHAVEFMYDIIKQNPGEITLLAIGPFTNVGLLLASYPEVAGMLKQIVVMGGRFINKITNYSTPLEWNVLCDPYAAAIVYNAPVKLRSVGLDVTNCVCLQKQDVEKRFTSKMLLPALDFAHRYFDFAAERKHPEQIIFHDPLAAATIFDPEICQFKKGNVDVELDSPRLKGFTHWEESPDGRHEIAVSVDAERFFEHYFSITA